MTGFNLSKQGIVAYQAAIAEEESKMAKADFAKVMAKHDADVGRAAMSMAIWAEKMRAIANGKSVKREVARQGLSSSKRLKR